MHTIYGSILLLFTMCMIALDVYIKLIGWIYEKVPTSSLAYEVHFFLKKR